MPTESFKLQAALELDRSHAAQENTSHTFSVPMEGCPELSVEIDLPQKRVLASGKFLLSSPAHEALSSDPDESGALTSEEMWSELKAINQKLESAIDQVVVGLKYYFNRYTISDRLSANELFWERTDDEHVRIKFPLRYIMSVDQCIYLDADGAVKLQAFIDAEKTMLTGGLRHLHRARTETNPTFQWIDATIAAELAIKECIIHLKPELEILLLEVPSPPLTKLYGVILESITGQRSSKLSAIRKGVEVRNRLVHRPTAEHVDKEDAVNYLDDIEIAIFELLSFMYPNDEVIERVFKKRVTVSVTSTKAT